MMFVSSTEVERRMPNTCCGGHAMPTSHRSHRTDTVEMEGHCGTETETPRDLERDRNASWLGGILSIFFHIFPLSVQDIAAIWCLWTCTSTSIFQQPAARSGYCQGRDQHQTVYTTWPRTFSSLGESGESRSYRPCLFGCNDLTGRPHHMVSI